MRKLLLVTAFLTVVAACAKNPENIGAITVAGDPYGRFSCSQLSAERLRIAQELEVAEAAQRSAASGDAMGVFLIGLPISSMSGNDQEAVIGVAKGRVQEIDRLRLARNCR